MNEKEKLAARIVLSERPWEEMKKIRLEKGLAQKVLAKKTGVCGSVVSDYEAGRRKNPGLNYVRRFVEMVCS